MVDFQMCSVLKMEFKLSGQRCKWSTQHMRVVQTLETLVVERDLVSDSV